MRIKQYINKITVLAIFLFQLAAFAGFSNAQTPAPREEKLLNGMKLLVWANPQAEKTSVKLRIHSGSAFDPLTREGVMALLGDILFPNETAKEYFAEDLGGSLEITSNYDYIQINASGDNDKILEILEAIAQAITRPQIDKETTAKVKTARLEKVKELEKNPAYIADNAVANRLFGNYPYGRAQFGTSETLSKIDFADILLAKQKFLTADNATLAVSGNVKFDLVFRAVRRYFGGWEKADRKVPATFTQPDKPDVTPLSINLPSIETSETRYAVNGLARNDKDVFALRILSKIIAAKFQDTSFQNKSFLLSGIVSGKPTVISQLKVTTSETKIDENKPEIQIKTDEFEKAKAEVLNELSQTNLLDFWLDVQTYKLVSVKDEFQKAGSVKLEDVERIYSKMRTQPVVTVTITKTPETKSNSN
jgi:zinc protease